MTRLAEDMVREFHERFGFHVEDMPMLAPWEIRKERARLIVEEAAEAAAELLATNDDTLWPDQLAAARALVDIFTDRCDPPQRRPMLDRIANELGDLAYVTAGGAVNNGVPLTAVAAEIHRANMAKLGPDGKPIINEHGKATKPAGWQPPDIAAVLAGTATQPGIRPVTYWEAWCTGDGSGEHLIQMGDFMAYKQVGHTADGVTESEGLVLTDGRVFCVDHIPADVCPDSADNQHEWDDDPDPDEASCIHCGIYRSVVAEMPSATPQAVTA